MANQLFPFALAALIFTSACGSSNSSKSDKSNCTPTNGNDTSKLVGIRLPSSAPTTPVNPGPSPISAAPKNETEPTSNSCDTPQAGNLSDTPNAGLPNNTRAPNIPVPPTGPQGPSSPGVGGARPSQPSLNVGNINGRWEFASEFCEDGTQTSDMQKIFRMMLSGDFNHSLTIKDSSVDEFTWLRLTIDSASDDTMMCTLMRKSSLSRVGNEFRLAQPAASFEDAGGLTPCNLQSVPAQTIEKMRISSQGGVLIIETLNSKECSGKSRVKMYSESNID